MKKTLYISVISTFILASCVPARKYQDLESKQQECSDQLDKLKSRNADLETLATEQHEKEEATKHLSNSHLLSGKSRLLRLRVSSRRYLCWPCRTTSWMTQTSSVCSNSCLTSRSSISWGTMRCARSGTTGKPSPLGSRA